MNKIIQFPIATIIFGNGFHRWLGLPTRYIDYRNFIKDNPKYNDCYHLLNIVANESGDKDWNKIEDDMFEFLKKSSNLSRNFSNIDLKNACIQKNQSLYDWIEYIRRKYNEELNEVYSFFETLSKENKYSYWTFNYVIDYIWKNNENDVIVTNTKGNNPKRAFTQLHYRRTSNNTSEILLGADLSQLREDYKNNPIDESLPIVRFCGKFSKTNACLGKPKVTNLAESFGDDFPWEPAQALMPEEMLGLRVNDWIIEPNHPKNVFKSIYFLGFSFGKQDIKYFQNNKPTNPFRWIYRRKGKIWISYYKENEREEIWENFEKCLNDEEKRYFKKTECLKKFDEMIKPIFGNELYIKLIEIQNKIKIKNRE